MAQGSRWAGFSLAVHAIGDRAVHEVLNAFTQLRRYERETWIEGLPAARYPAPPHRARQVIHPEDVGRLGALGVIASMQPIHAHLRYA